VSLLSRRDGEFVFIHRFIVDVENNLVHALGPIVLGQIGEIEGRILNILRSSDDSRARAVQLAVDVPAGGQGGEFAQIDPWKLRADGGEAYEFQTLEVVGQ